MVGTDFRSTYSCFNSKSANTFFYKKCLSTIGAMREKNYTYLRMPPAWSFFLSNLI